jgi:tellurite resistance protein
MNDRDLTSALNDFGIDRDSRDALVLLPLVWVAWADGTVDPAERALILDVAARHVHLGPEGARVLTNWLSFGPERARLEAAAALLVALDHRVRANERDDIVDFCRGVAAASGGLFGKTSAPEREAIELVAQSLAVEPHQAWDRLRARMVVEAHASPEDGWFDDERTNPVGATPTRATPAPPSPPAEGPPGLAWFDGAKVFVAPLAERLTVGRGRENDLQLAHDGQLSRNHAVFERRAEGVYLVDRGSLNGAWVNGERVSERRLFGGEIVTLGETRFRWRA